MKVSKTRVAAAEAAVGRLEAVEGEFGVVWTDKSLGAAWREGFATDCYVEEVLDGVEQWRVVIRPAADSQDLGQVYGQDGQVRGRLERAKGAMFHEVAIAGEDVDEAAIAGSAEDAGGAE